MRSYSRFSCINLAYSLNVRHLRFVCLEALVNIEPLFGHLNQDSSIIIGSKDLRIKQLFWDSHNLFGFISPEQRRGNVLSEHSLDICNSFLLSWNVWGRRYMNTSLLCSIWCLLGFYMRLSLTATSCRLLLVEDSLVHTLRYTTYILIYTCRSCLTSTSSHICCLICILCTWRCMAVHLVLVTNLLETHSLNIDCLVNLIQVMINMWRLLLKDGINFGLQLNNTVVQLIVFLF